MSANTLALEGAISAKKIGPKDTVALLLLIPTAICLFSILLAVEFPAFASTMALMGIQ